MTDIPFGTSYHRPEIMTDGLARQLRSAD